MSTKLRDGSLTDDPRLDRLVQFDERSRTYPITAVVPSRRPRSYTWRLSKNYVLDQGREGACVGYCGANELMARPSEVSLGSLNEATEKARYFYHEAQRIDPWQGGSYPGASPRYEGTSVLAGLKVLQHLGYFREYRWAFGIESLVLGIGHNGPAMLGVNWLDTWYNPSPTGFLERGGRVVGGHAILAVSVQIVWKSMVKFWKHRTIHDVDMDASYVVLHNSWGPYWGDNGQARISLSNLEWLMAQQGEAAFAVHRTIHYR